MTRSYLIRYIIEQFKERKMQHVQALLRHADGRLCIKFVSVDNDKLKDKVKALAGELCESLEFYSESKTTITYLI